MAEHRPSRPASVASNLATVLLVLTGIFAVYLIGTAVVGAIAGGHEVVAHQEVAADRLGSLPSSVVVGREVPVTIRIRDADSLQLTLATARDLIVIALGVGILWLVRGLLLSVRLGDPFTAANVRRLRTIGLIVVVGFPVAGFLIQLLEGWLASSSPVGELRSTFRLALSELLVAGLGIFVLSEVFAHGVRLREDVEGTV